jgi:hypothetical protein
MGYAVGPSMPFPRRLLLKAVSSRFIHTLRNTSGPLWKKTRVLLLHIGLGYEQYVVPHSLCVWRTRYLP